jgi:hypothetical protein
MHMRRFPNGGILLLCSFFVVSFAIAFSVNRYFPTLVIAGEASVGTWMSGVLLITCAVLSLVHGIQWGWYPWFLSSSFFFLLAADERFMFHEQMKDFIIFSYSHAPLLMHELPVVVAACAGGFVAWTLWKHLARGKIFLIGGVVLGLASVVFDIFSLGVLWEECFKLFGELSLACAFLKNHSQLEHP